MTKHYIFLQPKIILSELHKDVLQMKSSLQMMRQAGDEHFFIYKYTKISPTVSHTCSPPHQGPETHFLF